MLPPPWHLTGAHSFRCAWSPRSPQIHVSSPALLCSSPGEPTTCWASPGDIPRSSQACHIQDGASGASLSGPGAPLGFVVSEEASTPGLGLGLGASLSCQRLLLCILLLAHYSFILPAPPTLVQPTFPGQAIAPGHPWPLSEWFRNGMLLPSWPMRHTALGLFLGCCAEDLVWILEPSGHHMASRQSEHSGRLGRETPQASILASVPSLGQAHWSLSWSVACLCFGLCTLFLFCDTIPPDPH